MSSKQTNVRRLVARERWAEVEYEIRKPEIDKAALCSALEGYLRTLSPAGLRTFEDAGNYALLRVFGDDPGMSDFADYVATNPSVGSGELRRTMAMLATIAVRRHEGKKHGASRADPDRIDDDAPGWWWPQARKHFISIRDSENWPGITVREFSRIYGNACGETRTDDGQPAVGRNNLELGQGTYHVSPRQIRKALRGI